ncbi:MAG: ABC transporter ATP-binding protein, partial [Finegoldia magna]|nr:ABC transporter ATP-binding protein [Finegoldia magna]
MKKKYSTNDNIKFMFNLAWNNQKSLIFMLIIMAITTAGIDILQLYFTPQIIKMVENSQDFRTIMLTVVVFAVLIFVCSATKESLDLKILPKKIYVRTLILNQCIEKFLSMDYEMTLDKNVLDLSEKANVNLEGNDKATEHIWITMKDVLYLLISTSVYLILLARLPIFIILVSIIASLISFLYSKKLKQWKYDNRKTQARFEKEFNYINSVSSHKHAKDIRMFGLGNWL